MGGDGGRRRSLRPIVRPGREQCAWRVVIRDGVWIRALGRRVVKLDIKGFSRKTDKFTPIGEGDIDWADIRKALREINFYGWCAAEVNGGGPAELKNIAGQMDRVLGLA